MKVTLKALRVNKSMTQEEVASMIGVTKTTVGNWENGYNTLDAPTLLKLCTLYECGVDDIILPKKLAKREEKL